MKKTTKFDRDGTQICEGDIVLLENWNDSETVPELKDETRIIKYRNDTFYLEEINSFHPMFCDLEMANMELTRVVRSTRK